MASTSSKQLYNKSYSTSSSTTTDTSTEISTPLQYDTEEDLNQVFISLRKELEIRTERKWENEGREKGVDKEVLMRVVLENFFDNIVPNIMKNCSIGGVPFEEYKKGITDGNKGVQIEPFSNELHEKVVKYQDGLFNTRAENVNKRKELPIQTVDALQNVFQGDLERLVRLESERIEFLEKKAPRSAPRRSIGGSTGKPNPVQVETDFNFGKSTIENLLVKVPLLSTSAEHATQVTQDAALVD